MILPLIVVLDRRAQPADGGAQPQRMQLNGEMGASHAGALQRERRAAGQAVRPPAATNSTTFSDRAGDVRDTGVQLAMTSRLYYAGLTLMGALGTAAVYWLGGSRRHQRLAHARLARRARRAGAAGCTRRSPTCPARASTCSPRSSASSAASRSSTRRTPIADTPDAVDLRRPARAGSSSRTCGSAIRRRPTCRSQSLEGDGDDDAVDRAVGVDPARRVASTPSPARSPRSSARPARARPRCRSLVPRLYDVTSGAVRIDGHDVRDVTLASLGRGDRRRHPGPAPVPRHDRRQPALRPARRHRRRAWSPRARRRASTTLIAQPARRLRHHRRRARLPHVGRREAAAGHRPAAAQEPGHRHPRRGHRPPRLRDRGAGAAGAGRGAARPGIAGDRPPAVDDPGRRPDPGARPGPHRRARARHGELLGARRALRRAVRDAVRFRRPTRPSPNRAGACRGARPQRNCATAIAALAAMVERAGPIKLRPRNTEGSFAALVRSIAFQQLAGAAAATIHGRFRALVDGPLTPEAVLALPEERMRGAGLSAAKTGVDPRPVGQGARRHRRSSTTSAAWTTRRSSAG